MQRLASIFIVSFASLLACEPVTEPSPGECPDGHEWTSTDDDCYADASCFELAGGGWCTGHCPEGTELDLSGEPACVPASPECLEGFEVVPLESDCLADAVCYPEAGVFCTGECPDGMEFIAYEYGPACVPASSQCLEGFDWVSTSTECYADASCFELADGSWCTGECPEGTELDLSAEPACVPATPQCLEGFEVVPLESDCLADAVCYPEAGVFCTGECPEGTEFTLDETGPACVPR